MNIDKNEIVQLTEEYGGEWGINHTRRLLHLISIIGENKDYDQDVVWVAAYLHDWGGYSPWAQKDVDHAARSGQVADSFLRERAIPENTIKHLLECITLHHSSDPGRSIESILLSDADILDFLGVMGVLRDFSKNTKDLRKAFEITKKRRGTLPGMLLLERSKEIAAERIGDMDLLYGKFEKDSFGFF